MFSLKFLLAMVVVAIADTCIQWLFIGFLFHRYQAATPMVWRKESSRSYVASSVLSLFFAVMICVIVSLWRQRYGAITLTEGVEFGVLCWLAFIIPLELGSAVYVNYSRMFVVGKCLSGLAECIAAAVLAVWLL
jgi:hypothetical protein